MNGINLLNLHTSDELVYGRMLLDALFFMRNEQKDSLVFATIRSEKPGLDRRRVEMLLSKLPVTRLNKHQAVYLSGVSK